MIGQFATSKAGHDRGTLYVIVAQDADYVELCEGRYKTIEHPKRKRKKHIQPIKKKVGEELLDALFAKHASNEQIKYAIRQYQKECDKEKDGGNVCQRVM